MLKAARALLARGAHRLRPGTNSAAIPADFDDETRETIEAIHGFTRTSPERIAAACEAIRYISRCSMDGAIVECGVWRGGSIIAMLRTLQECNDLGRSVYLYDTFEGMSAPSEADVSFRGERASQLLLDSDSSNANSVWCKASLEEVARNVGTVGYDSSKINYVRGPVEETIPQTVPDRISLLRLDTDWYESTRHELVHLFPRLVSGGVLIVDDYGHWQGARKAVDEYMHQYQVPLLLNRIDYTGRIAVKR